MTRQFKENNKKSKSNVCSPHSRIEKMLMYYFESVYFLKMIFIIFLYSIILKLHSKACVHRSGSDPRASPPEDEPDLAFQTDDQVTSSQTLASWCLGEIMRPPDIRLTLDDRI